MMVDDSGFSGLLYQIIISLKYWVEIDIFAVFLKYM
jgi:hypothetical protein